MTDEQYHDLRAFTEQYAVPPHPPLHNGFGIRLFVMDVDEPQLVPPQGRARAHVKMNRADYDDLRRRAARHRLAGPTPREALWSP